MQTTDREDCTPMAWYSCLYAPRTEGAYDSHHRTAGIAGRTRRSGRVAARGTRAASRADAADRRNEAGLARNFLQLGGRTSPASVLRRSLASAARSVLASLIFSLKTLA